MLSRLIDMTGCKFGRALVVSRAADYIGPSRRFAQWHCLCDCGTQFITSGISLRTGHTSSCGCYCKERLRQASTKHGYSPGDKSKRPSEYASWCHAKGRCYNPRNAKYSAYGARGIYMCERWRTDYAAFYRDMGPRPSPQHTLDRIDNDGPYSPENCRWSLPDVQRRNSRRVIKVGDTTLKDFAISHGVNYKSMHHYVAYRGMSPEAALAHILSR